MVDNSERSIALVVEDDPWIRLLLRDLLTDEDTVQRIKDLVIPPAWKKVWISPFANGHIQAVGTDAAGRRQYLYHQNWQQERAEEKFDRVLELSKGLPAYRERIARDLSDNAAPLVITLGEEVWATLLGMRELQPRWRRTRLSASCASARARASS